MKQTANILIVSVGTTDIKFISTLDGEEGNLKYPLPMAKHQQRKYGRLGMLDIDTGRVTLSE